MSKTPNLTATLYKKGCLKVEPKCMPKPKEDEVLLKMEVVGICGSDVHYYVDGKVGPFELKKPMVMGHEGCGTVTEVGKCVKSLKCGDRVAIEPQVTCRKCEYCKKGLYNLCPDVKFCATPPVDGNLRKFYCHAEDFCHVLPKCLDFEDGALIEPLSCAVHACNKSKITTGSVVCIFGSGPIGLCCLMTAKARGAKKVIISDKKPYRLQKAKCLGADFLIHVTPKLCEDVFAKKITCMLGEQPNVCIEAAGAEQCVRVALKVTKAAGSICLIGLGDFEMNLPMSSCLIGEVDIRGIFRYRNCYPQAIELVRSGKVKVKELVSHRIKLEDAVKAFEVAKCGKGDPIKILITCNDTGDCPDKSAQTNKGRSKKRKAVSKGTATCKKSKKSPKKTSKKNVKSECKLESDSCEKSDSCNQDDDDDDDDDDDCGQKQDCNDDAKCSEDTMECGESLDEEEKEECSCGGSGGESLKTATTCN